MQRRSESSRPSLRSSRVPRSVKPRCSTLSRPRPRLTTSSPASVPRSTRRRSSAKLTRRRASSKRSSLAQLPTGLTPLRKQESTTRRFRRESLSRLASSRSPVRRVSPASRPSSTRPLRGARVSSSRSRPLLPRAPFLAQLPPPRAL